MINKFPNLRFSSFLCVGCCRGQGKAEDEVEPKGSFALGTPHDLLVFRIITKYKQRRRNNRPSMTPRQTTITLWYAREFALNTSDIGHASSSRGR